MIRPGGYDIVAEAVREAGLDPGARLLDVGCGEGETLTFLRESFEIEGLGIDRSAELIRRGQARDASLDIREGEADFLDFESRSFDAVLMECVLSLVEMRTEALHEAWCILKPGGKLIITDLCYRPGQDKRHPSPELEGLPTDAGFATGTAPPPEGEEEAACACEEHDHSKDTGRCDHYTPGIPAGIFNVDQLVDECKELEYRFCARKDKTKELDAFAAEMIFEHGSLEAWFAALESDGLAKDSFCGKIPEETKPGYFWLVMEKIGE
jgi:SAM-dependent methyltransferase